jgi:hypothetical protein
MWIWSVNTSPFPAPPPNNRVAPTLDEAKAEFKARYEEMKAAGVTMAVERLKQHGEGAGELASLREILAPHLSMLLGNRGTPVTLHRNIVRGD